LGGASSAAGAAGSGAGAGAGASFGFNVTRGFNAGPAFGPSLGVGNTARDLAPVFIRIVRTVAGSGIKLSGRAKIAMALVLLIASGVGGSSQLVRDAVSAAGSNWIGPLTTQVGQQFQRLWRALPNALPRPRISVSAAPRASAPPASAQQTKVTGSPPAIAAPLATTAVAPALQDGYAIGPATDVPATIESPSFAPQQARSAAGNAQYTDSGFARSLGSTINPTSDPFRLPSHTDAAARSFSSSAGTSGAASSGHRSQDDGDRVANHAIAAINHWMLAAERRTSGNDDGSAGDGMAMGMFEKNEQLASRDDIPQLTAEQWLDRLLRMIRRDERFRTLGPQTLVDLAQRAAQDGWDYRVLTVDRLALALGLSAPDPTTGNDRNNVLSLNHPITPVPEPTAIGLTTLGTAAGVLLRRRRRR
jgi:hypothetical protein